jgi:serine/threonine protein kinase
LAKSFITAILEKDPKQRLDIDSLLNHPFLTTK